MKHFPTLLILSALIQSTPAIAATLRPMTTLTSGQVRLSDLFDGIGPAGARILGASPTPGARLVVEAPQLAAIARQFSVDWRPASPGDSIVLDRPGRMLPRDTVLDALKTALISSGASADADIDLTGYTAPMVALDTPPQLAVTQLNYDNASGRFTAAIEIAQGNSPAQQLRLAGTVQQMQDMPVLTHRIAPGQIITPDDLRMTRRRATIAPGDMVTDPAQAVGLAPRHMLGAGAPLSLADLVRPPAITKGTRVTMRLQSPGLNLLAQGEAQESGGIGDRIAVLNPVSGAIVQGEILSSTEVRVDPASTPILPTNGRPVRISQETVQ